ncbi:Retrovirus-related Pol poly from transposon gypsy [Paramuricea clavata]|uniref:Retrovirus-related Pol poly from transposon gypsy n=1 Tax=Paramuricea clavata TaxID=317549 RepID=A0A7D9JRM7_PARCT|nr:Retrovirus-related Pol poly from transposon gypsy [Paramuricea clavata]
MNPPKLNFTLKTESDFNNKPHDWSSAEIQSQLPTYILLITANDHEFNACYSYMTHVERGYCEELHRCVYFGQFGDKGDQNVKVALLKCQLGSDEGRLALKDAAEILKPKKVFFVGTCASKKPKKTKLGDVVVSAKLGTYDRKVMPDGTVNYRGAKVNETMARLILHAADGWKPPLKDQSSLKVKVYRDAVVLDGSDLVNSCERQQDLVDYFPDAFGLEMKGADCKDYKSAIRVLEQLFVKTPNEIFARHLLATRRQKSGETLTEFLQELRKLSKDCNLKNVTAEQYREELVRDSFINGLLSPLIRQRLLENKQLDLQTAFDQANALDLAQKNSEAYRMPEIPTTAAVSSPPTDEVAGAHALDYDSLAATFTSKKCYFCGDNLHNRRSCPARNSNCNNCGKKGHYAKVCKSKAPSITTASMFTPTLC